MEVMFMTIIKKLKDYLEKNQVRYEEGVHEPVYTSQEIAATMHVPGKEWRRWSWQRPTEDDNVGLACQLSDPYQKTEEGLELQEIGDFKRKGF